MTCPQTVDEAFEYLCASDRPQVDQYFVFCNACGGVNVYVVWGFGGFYFSFDADQKLVGATISDDTPTGPCNQILSIYGTACAMSEDFRQFLPPPVDCPQ